MIKLFAIESENKKTTTTKTKQNKTTYNKNNKNVPLHNKTQLRLEVTFIILVNLSLILTTGIELV